MHPPPDPRSPLRFTSYRARVLALALVASFVFLSRAPALAGSQRVLAPVAGADGRLGLCDVLPGVTPGADGLPWAQLAYDAGARVNRWEIRWDRVEPQPNLWDFAATDRVVQTDAQYGLDVLGILIGTPAWGTAPGNLPGNGLPRGLYRSYTDPQNLWADYVRATVTRYAGQVKYWEVWNEPDVQYFWTGTPDNYYRLLQVTYKVVKQTDPRATVMMAGMVVPGFAFARRVLEDARRLGSVFDAVAWHAYGPAFQIYVSVVRYKQLLALEGFGDRPVWVTEDGFPASNPNGEQRQAAYVIQTALYALAAGADRVLFYRASDDGNPKSWGLITAQGTPRMGYVALQVAAQYFAHAAAIIHAPLPAMERFVLYEPSQRVTVAWSQGVHDSTAKMPAYGPAATLVDWQGGAKPLTPAGGVFLLPAPGASYNAGIDAGGAIVGGPPSLLVEDNTQPAGLVSRLAVPPVAGSRRRLVILNPAASPLSIQVTAAAHPSEYVVVRLAPRTLQTVDLDLLAGTSYHGLYSVAGSGPMSGQVASAGTVSQPAPPSGSWFVASAPAALHIGSAGGQAADVTLNLYGTQGRLRATDHLHVAGGHQVGWLRPQALATMKLSMALTSTRPTVLSADAGAQTAPQLTWYAVQPRASSLHVDNPDPNAPAQVTVHFVGPDSPSDSRVTLPPHGSTAVPITGAQALAVTADHPVVAGWDPSPQPDALVSAPATTASVVTAGPTTGASLYNPSTLPAHVTLVTAGRTGSSTRTAVVAPQTVLTIRTRTVQQPARGVLLSSDVPVVAVPAL